MTKQLETSRGKELEKITPIKLDNKFKRSLIIALINMLKTYGQTPPLAFQIGQTKIYLNKNDSFISRNKQIGNFVMYANNEKPIYGETCVSTLVEMLKTPISSQDDQLAARKKSLINLFQSKGGIIKPITIHDFNKDALIKINDEDHIQRNDPEFNKAKSRADYLNGLIFLMFIGEVFRRLYRDSNGKIHTYDEECSKVSDTIPIALAQARTLSLLLSEKITLEDILGESVEYDQYKSVHRAHLGIATGKNTIRNLSIVASKFSNINSFYNNHITTEEKRTYSTSFVANGRNKMQQELKDCYGGGYESSGESDYSDSEEDIYKDITSLHDQEESLFLSENESSDEDNFSPKTNEKMFRNKREKNLDQEDDLENEQLHASKKRH